MLCFFTDFTENLFALIAFVELTTTFWAKTIVSGHFLA